MTSLYIHQIQYHSDNLTELNG